MKKVLLIAATSLILAACAGTQFNWDSARQIKVGMAEADVVKLMGKPNRINSTDAGLQYIWVFANGFTGSVRTVSTVFNDGKVSAAPVIPDSF